MTIRYLGHKPFNWPAAVLIFGWMAATFAALAAASISSTSIFHATIAPGAIFWRQEMSLAGFALTSVPFVLGAVALWLHPRTDHYLWVGRILVGSGVVAFLLGIAWDARAGYAVYPDRLLHRSSGFAELRTEHWADIRRVEVACSLQRKRRSLRPSAGPTYRPVFESGYSVDLWGGGGFSPSRAEWKVVDIVRFVDREARTVNAVRGPARKPDGTLISDRGCLTILSRKMDLDLKELRHLFEVHQSELRAGEYVLLPVPPGS